MVDVIIGLLVEDRMMMSDVSKYADFRTGRKKLWQLLDKGMVALEIDDTFPYTNWYRLTDKGKIAAELLAQAKKIIEND